MTAITATKSTADFDPDAVFAQIVNPASDGHRYPLYKMLRDAAPVFQTRFPGLDGWYVVSNYEYARELTFSANTQNNAKVLELQNLSEDGTYSVMNRLWMEYRDDVRDHDRIRRVLFPHFAPRNIEHLRPKIRQLVLRLLDDIADPTQIEFIGEFAFLLPSLVIASLLGIDVGDSERFQRTMEAYLKVTATVRALTDAERAERDAMAEEFLGLFREYLTQRRRQPEDDLISKLAQEQSKGTISDEELLAQFVFVLIAGHSTTADMMGNIIVALSRNPEQLGKILAQPERIPAAINEFIRFDSSLETATRVVNEPVTLGNTILPRGARALIMLHAAHHDPVVFENPETLDIDRKFAKPAFPFGGGRYLCLGMHLARMEIEEALREFLRRFPHFTIDELVWQGGLVSHGPKRLVITTSGFA